MLETVDVSATRTDDIPGKAALLDESDVKDTGAVHPAELMDQVPGVWISRGGGQENLTALRSAVFTGPGSCGEFLFAEDGVPVRPSGFCNVNQFIEINSEQAGGIEVLSGTSAGSFYGANAIHGVINTLSLPLEERHSMRLEGGPNDYARMLWQRAMTTVIWRSILRMMEAMSIAVGMTNKKCHGNSASNFRMCH